MKTSPAYIFKDCGKPVEQEPTWQGELICVIFEAKDVRQAIKSFLKFYPEHSNGDKLKSTITISTIF